VQICFAVGIFFFSSDFRGEMSLCMLADFCSLCESPLTVTWIDLLFVVVSRFLPCRCNSLSAEKFSMQSKKTKNCKNCPVVGKHFIIRLGACQVRKRCLEGDVIRQCAKKKNLKADTEEEPLSVLKSVTIDKDAESKHRDAMNTTMSRCKASTRNRHQLE
jgi:hypothetical protein